MKKIIAISILVIYSTLSVIDMVSMHFCHGKLVSVSLTAPPQNCCNSNSQVHSHCCENLVIDVDFDTDHLASASTDIVFPGSDCEILKVSPHQNTAQQNTVDLTKEPVKPVPKLTEDRFILYSFFLIYG